MDSLKNEAKRSYTYVSRYASFPYFYHEVDDKYIYGITSQLNDSTLYVLHTIKSADNLDALSFKYYGRPDLYWIIADFNKIQDPFEKLFGKYKTLKIPSLSNISFKDK